METGGALLSQEDPATFSSIGTHGCHWVTPGEVLASVFKGCIIKKLYSWSSRRGSVEMNLANIHEDEGSIPGLAQWV